MQPQTAPVAQQQDQAKAPSPPPLKRQDEVLAKNNAHAGTLMRTAARRDLFADTVEERQSWLDSQKDAALGEIVDATTKRLRDALSAQMGKVITAQKQDILKSAHGAVKTQLDQQAHAGERGDLKPETLVAESGAWTEAATVAAENAKHAVAQHDDELKAAGAGAFTVGKDVSLKKDDRLKHLAAVKAEAKRLIDLKAKQVETQLTAEANKAQTQKQMVDSAKAKASTAATEGVHDEVEARHASNDDVEKAVEKPVKETADSIREATRKYLEKGVGAQGTGWFRSKQFKEFHANMKKAARKKGHEETDKAIAEKRKGGAGTQAGHEAEFEYQTSKAQQLTHKAAKLELREIMKEFAGDLLKQTGDAVQIEPLLKTPATAAAWAALRADPTKPASKTAAAKAAASAAKAAKPEVLEKFHAKAQELKNAYVKVGDDPQAQAQQAKNQEVVTQKVNPQMETRKDDQGHSFGQRMINQAIEAPTAGKGLELVAGLIDLAAPQRGDSAELEVELKIPASHGAFCFFKVKGSAERSEHMEVGIDISFGAGWETWGLSARGGFNVFLKAGAIDTVGAMQLIHYGAFRNLTHVSDNAANFWAGATDATHTAGEHDKEIGKNEQAELWAAMTEERLFGGKDEKAFVEVGGGFGAKAKLNAGVTGEAALAITSARRWDKGVFEAIEQDKVDGGHDFGLGKMGDRRTGSGDLKSRQDRKDLAMKKRAAVAKHVKRKNAVKVELSMDAIAGGQGFSIGLEGTFSKTGPKMKGGIEASASIPYDPSQDSSKTLLSKIAATYVPTAIAGAKKLYDLYKLKNPDEDDKSGSTGARGAGMALDGGEDLLFSLDAGGATNGLLEKLSNANPQNLAGSKPDGVNDTAREWLGHGGVNDHGIRGLMGDNGDMSKTVSDAPSAQPFGATSALQITMALELETGKPAKLSFTVSKSSEYTAGVNLGVPGLGLKAKLTRQQELAGISFGGGDGVKPFLGGRG